MVNSELPKGPAMVNSELPKGPAMVNSELPKILGMVNYAYFLIALMESQHGKQPQPTPGNLQCHEKAKNNYQHMRAEMIAPCR